ncbi:MAG: VWA domain-containing protein [DPANN group archaeon]|nr:VWA domain-containing protein [DPANN group archaeon]
MGRLKGDLERDLCLMVDSSGSVEEEIFEAVKSVVPTLFQMANVQKRRFGVLTFSDKTQFSGWLTSYNPRLLGRVLQWQGMGSELNTTILAGLESKNRNYDAVMLTDGQILNMDKVVATFYASAMRGNRIGIFNIEHTIPWGVFAAHYETVPRDPDEIKRAILKYVVDTLF